MKLYVIVTGVLFAVLTIAHLWRMLAEQMSIAGNPVYVTITVVAAGLAAWAIALLVRARK